VRAENLVRSSGQQSCPPTRPAVISPVMFLRFMFLLTTRLAAGLRPARREEGRKTAPILILRHRSPSCSGGSHAARSRTGQTGPGRDPARRDAESPSARAAAAGHPGHHRALAPRHRPPLRRQVRQATTSSRSLDNHLLMHWARNVGLDAHAGDLVGRPDSGRASDGDVSGDWPVVYPDGRFPAPAGTAAALLIVCLPAETAGAASVRCSSVVHGGEQRSVGSDQRGSHQR
jgi:hypothetical protein